MRKLALLFIAVSMGYLVPPTVRAAEVSVDFFYNSLQPHGEWVEAANYGYVWHPNNVDREWRPYTRGSWAYTDGGWTFVSDEPFGPITYHYGRWVSLEGVGWSWVPGTEWAPAWVSWRHSDKYIGWAPLPPEAEFREGAEIAGWADSYYDIGPASYSFVEVALLGSPRLEAVILPEQQNVTIIEETRNITDIRYENNGVFVGGPDFQAVSRLSRDPIRQLTLQRDATFAGNRIQAAQISGKTLRVAAPQVQFRADAAPSHVGQKLQTARVNNGWQGVKGADQLRAQIDRQSPKRPANLPAHPKFDRNALAGSQTNAQPNGGRPTGAAATERNARATAGDTRATTPPTAASPGSVTAPTDRPTASEERPLPNGERKGKNGANATANTREGAARSERTAAEGNHQKPDGQTTTPDRNENTARRNKGNQEPDANRRGSVDSSASAERNGENARSAASQEPGATNRSTVNREKNPRNNEPTNRNRTLAVAPSGEPTSGRSPEGKARSEAKESRNTQPEAEKPAERSRTESRPPEKTESERPRSGGEERAKPEASRGEKEPAASSRAKEGGAPKKEEKREGAER